jgi:hypothetical protein
MLVLMPGQTEWQHVIGGQTFELRHLFIKYLLTEHIYSIYYTTKESLAITRLSLVV